MLFSCGNISIACIRSMLVIAASASLNALMRNLDVEGESKMIKRAKMISNKLESTIVEEITMKIS